MEREAIKQHVQEVFRAVFGNKELSVSESTGAADIAMWDSLTHVELISEIEKKFRVKFSFVDAMNFNNVGDMISCIEKLLNKSVN